MGYYCNRIGLMACVILLAGCASLPNNVERTPSYASTDTADTRLGLVSRNEEQAHLGQSGFHALEHGINAFASRLSVIVHAEKTLDLQYYIWHDDLTGKMLLNYLLAAADRGVRVRILLDDLNTSGMDEALAIIDAHPRIEIRLFNPFANRSARIMDIVSDFGRINRRMHNKALIADNQAAIVGGRNIGDEYFDASGEFGFADMDVLAVGPVVNEVSQSFDLYWNSQWAFPLIALSLPDAPSEPDWRALEARSNNFIAEAELTPYVNALRTFNIDTLPEIGDINFSWGQWKLIYDQPNKVESKGVKKDTYLAPTLKEWMDNVESELIIVSPYFVPGTKFTEFLTGLVDKGIKVRVLTNSLSANDVAIVHAGYQRYRKDLVRGGVELYEYKRVNADGGEETKTKAKWPGASLASLHGKYLGADKRFVFVGSFNMDARSVALNTELGVLFESSEYGQRLSRAFDENIIQVAYRLTLDEDSNLRWTTLEAGELVEFDSEPLTGFWKRFYTNLLSIFVPESQL
ncbi:phospholipase D family protein [Marinobacter changyiensis]|uniref:phospholipase D family protein n=1 Tax=Marinobacter changyiensis TaxID=2604091 RepID=UPI001264612C|nr:phospholipase D family protein [Marinobacter changyiensis]